MTSSGYITFTKCCIPARIFSPLLASMMGILCLYSAAAWADESIEMVVPSALESQPSMFEEMDAPRDYLSEKIVELSTGIDHFFGDPRYYQEHNKSVIQLYLNHSITEGGKFITWMDGQAKLELPAAQRRFQLVLETNSEKKTTSDVKKDQTTPLKDEKVPTQYSAALRFEKAEESHWHYSVDTGAQFQFPLDPFVRTRGSYELPVADWRLKLAETVFWFGTIGLGQTTQFDMEHVLSDPLLFRATTTATCMEAPQLCNVRQDLSIFHTLSERSANLYQLSVLGDDNPKLRETAYVLLTRYRYRLHREWVYFEVIPQIFFPRTDDFKMNASLLFRLEMLFGATK